MGYREKLKVLGAAVPEIYFPAKTVDLTKFSVVACDQYSAQPEYWDRVKSFVGSAPSSLNLMMPEAWLGKDKAHENSINSEMARYISDGTLVSLGEGMVFLHRLTTTGWRKGLVLALDLEQYDFTPGSGTLIRATEMTVVDRLPTRIEIRKNAPLEMPHIMVLLNDRRNLLMDMLERNAATGAPLYDFDLMENSGHLTGWFINNESIFSKIADILSELLKEDSSGMLYAMGDGNHSFAAAKAHWDNIKKKLAPEERENHPARYGLVELVNLYDEALAFEPIHRLIMNVDPSAIQQELDFDAENPPSLQDLQPRLDKWLADHPESSIEYIHGADDCRKLGSAPGNLAVIWDKFDKNTLFSDVAQHGVLVRKTFSMGSAPDKRFYLECRKIK